MLQPTGIAYEVAMSKASQKVPSVQDWVSSEQDNERSTAGGTYGGPKNQAHGITGGKNH